MPIFVMFFSFFFVSCTSYTDMTHDMRKLVKEGEYEKAEESLNTSKIAKKSQDRVLYLMEKGMLEYLSKRFEKAPETWRRASDRSNELYTLSISNSVAQIIVNDQMSDYRGEAHERLLLPIFSSLSFLANNEPKKAMVEIRKSYEVLNVLKSENNGKNNFKYDAFSHYLAAFVSEMHKDWDDAIIEYQNALEDYLTFPKGSVVIDPKLFADPLGRLAEYRKRKDILDYIESKGFTKTSDSQISLMDHAEILVVYEVGQVPLKAPENFFIPLNDQVLRISFPVYKGVTYHSKHAEIFLNGEKIGDTQTIEDIGGIAKLALEDRRIKDFAIMIGRQIAKYQLNKALHNAHPALGALGNLASVVTETADTRSWTLLPDKIQTFRVRIPSRQKNCALTIKPQIGEEVSVSCHLKKGDKKVVRLRTFQ